MRNFKCLALLFLLLVPKEGLTDIIVEIPDNYPPDIFHSQGVPLSGGNSAAQSFYLDKGYRIESLEGFFQYDWQTQIDQNATAILYANNTSSGKNLPGTTLFTSSQFTLPGTPDPMKGFFGISGLNLELDQGIYWLAFTSTSDDIMMPFLYSNYSYKGAIFYSSSGHWISFADDYFGIRVQGTPVPEPSTMLLLGSGLAGLVGYGRRRMNK